MDLSQIKQICEVYGEIAAQEKLNEGWILLAVAGGKDESGYPCMIYSLGRAE